MFLARQKISLSFKCITAALLGLVICFCSSAQCPTPRQFWDKILAVENSQQSVEQKLQEVILLRNQFEKCGIEKDSVYARILHRMGALQYQRNEYTQAIQNTINAVRINTSGTKGACIGYAANSYYNIGLCYYAISRYNEVLLYYDSLIAAGTGFPETKKFISRARLRKGNVYYKKGDFEKDIEETTLGLKVAEEMQETVMIIDLLLERSQSYEMEQQLTPALNDVNRSLALLQNSEDYDVWANAYRYKADILADQHNCTEALSLYKKAIAFRIKTDNSSNIATDYNDAGYLLMYKCNNISEAKKYFSTAYNMASRAKDNNVCALACNNLAQISFYTQDYMKAVQQYQEALQFLVPHYKLSDIHSNPPRKELAGLESKKNLDIFLDNKSKCLLYLYKQTYNIRYLKSSIATALLTDSIITDLRHEQSGVQTKLYWRNDTRDFFTRSMEACYLDNNPNLAFFFMEKSRAVLLNDKLNELGASARLPAAEAAKEESLQINITVQQQKLALLEDTAKEYVAQQYKLLQAKEDFEHYIKSLEQKYPAYYQYKYADEVPSLTEVQQYLAKNNQSFVHYFMGDTVTYILAITPGSTKLTRLSKKDFNRDQLFSFLQFCSGKENLNNHYSSFAALSHSIYKTLFLPLQVPRGRVIICADNIVIPFEALCTDEQGKQFLLYHFNFSYVYSARYLIKQFSNATASGNFLGFAPVSFASRLDVPDLKNAADALKASSAYYSSNKLFSYKSASRSNFFKYTSSYSVVSIFSHARADTTGDEPVLFMQDSLIYLSELQLLNNPATKLVLLSACQTNIGKTATGEGIYSLARGFASAGIPSVVATLWKADEQTIYSISEKFNEYLSKGMNKDEALQKAKLYFIEHNGSEKMLPYYWSNMVMIGNAEPITLSEDDGRWWWIAGIGVIAVVLVVLIAKRKNG